MPLEWSGTSSYVGEGLGSIVGKISDFAAVGDDYFALFSGGDRHGKKRRR